MVLEVRDGWMFGSLRDDVGRDWPIVRHKQASRGPTVSFPDLCLHTTETDGYVEELEFPSQFQVGEGKIGQHIRLGLQGDAVLEHDSEVVGIEMVGRSQLHRWLPAESTLGPCIALVAWLHRSGKIRTGLERPNPDWPVVLDRMPAADTSYYRRHDGTWRSPGVYGHVEIPGNSHYDPGSFDYPAFFARVQAALDPGKDDDAMYESYKRGFKDFIQTAREKGSDPGPPPEHWADEDRKFGWAAARWGYLNPKPATG